MTPQSRPNRSAFDFDDFLASAEVNNIVRGAVHRNCHRGASRHDREDQAQELFCELIKARDHFENGSGDNYLGLAKVVCRNRFVSMTRRWDGPKQSVCREATSLNNFFESADDDESTLHEALPAPRRYGRDVDLESDVADIIDVLPPRQREIAIELMQGKTFKAIARQLGNVRDKVRGDADALRQQLERHGLREWMG